MVGRGVFVFDFVLFNIDVEIPLRFVVFAQRVQIIQELVLLKAAAAGNPGNQESVFAGVDLVAEGAGIDMVVASEINDADDDGGAFIDGVGHYRLAGVLVGVHRGVDLDLRIPGFLVKRDERVLVMLELRRVERIAGDGLDLLRQAGLAILLVALEYYGGNARLGKKVEIHPHAARRQGFALRANKVVIASRVEGVDGLVD